MVRRIQKRRSNDHGMLMNLVKNDPLVYILSLFTDNITAVKSTKYASAILNKVIEKLKIHIKTYKLTIPQKIEKFFFGIMYSKKVRGIIESMTNEQIYLTINGKFNKELKNGILFGTPLPVVDLENDPNYKLYNMTFLTKEATEIFKSTIPELSDADLIAVYNNQDDIRNKLFQFIGDSIKELPYTSWKLWGRPKRYKKRDTNDRYKEWIRKRSRKYSNPQ
jgi:hypothetical protein